MKGRLGQERLTVVAVCSLLRFMMLRSECVLGFCSVKGVALAASGAISGRGLRGNNLDERMRGWLVG